jgi:ABC-type lipoprotein release transport system permease subunit
MKKKCLEDGMCNIIDNDNNHNIDKDMSNEILKENFSDINVVLIDKQKNKKEKNIKKINRNKCKSAGEAKKWMESDGEYIRRIELEAVSMLLILLPSCV